MIINCKLLNENATAPQFAKPGDAGADLIATSKEWRKDGKQIVYGTGVAVEIPEGFVGLVFPRSSVRNYDLSMSNSVGVIDSGYRGEIMVTFNLLDEDHSVMYDVSEKVGQLVIVPIPNVSYVKVKQLSDSERGIGGFGSTGVKS